MPLVATRQQHHLWAHALQLTVIPRHAKAFLRSVTKYWRLPNSICMGFLQVSMATSWSLYAMMSGWYQVVSGLRIHLIKRKLNWLKRLASAKASEDSPASTICDLTVLLLASARTRFGHRYWSLPGYRIYIYICLDSQQQTSNTFLCCRSLEINLNPLLREYNCLFELRLKAYPSPAPKRSDEMHPPRHKNLESSV